MSIEAVIIDKRKLIKVLLEMHMVSENPSSHQEMYIKGYNEALSQVMRLVYYVCPACQGLDIEVHSHHGHQTNSLGYQEDVDIETMWCQECKYSWSD